MNTRRAARIVLAVLALSPVTALAEVSVDRLADGTVAPFFEVSETGPWAGVRGDIDAGDLLNPSGDSNGDGWPLILMNAAAGRVEVLWSSGGEHRDVYHAFHDGTAWSTAANLSDQTGVDHLPVAQTDGIGNVFVAWERERNGRHAVFGSALSEPEGQVAFVELTARSRRGRFPSLVVHDDVLWVASQEIGSASDGSPQVVLDRVDVPRDSVGHCVDGGEDTIDIARQVVVDTNTGDPGASVGLQLHSEAGRLWMDWIDAPGVLGWVEQVGDDWSDPSYEEFDPDDGDTAARETVREIVLGL